MAALTTSAHSEPVQVQIDEVRLFRYRIPLALPLVLKGETLTHREGLLIHLRSGDTEGWGETVPLPGFSAEDLDTALHQLRQATASLIDRSLQVRDITENKDLAPSVRFGLELACCRLLAQLNHTNLFTVLGWESIEPVVYVNGLLPSEPQRIIEKARSLCEAGYRTIKLKVGRRAVVEDIRLVHALREAIGPDVNLRLDANRAWSYEQAVAFAKVDLSIEYIEEPLADPSQLRRLVEETGLPVALDETLPGLSPSHLHEHGYARAVVLKPTFLGGLTATLAYARQAQALGMKVVISAAFESGVVLSALAVLAAAVGRQTAMGFDTYRWLSHDLIEPSLDMHNGRIDVQALLQPPAVRMDLLEEL